MLQHVFTLITWILDSRIHPLYYFIASCRCRELLLFDFPLRRRVRFLRVGSQFKSRPYETGTYLGERMEGLDLRRKHVVDYESNIIWVSRL